MKSIVIYETGCFLLVMTENFQVPDLVHGIQVLEFLASQSVPRNITEIANALEFPKKQSDAHLREQTREVSTALGYDSSTNTVPLSA